MGVKHHYIRSSKAKAKTSLLWFTLLVLAVVVFVVWAVVAKSPGKTPHAANVSCALGTTTVAPGDQMSIAHTGFSDSAGGESIWIYGVNWQGEVAKTSDSTSFTKYQAFNVPYPVPDGQYNILIVTRYPVTKTVCSGGPFNVARNWFMNMTTQVNGNTVTFIFNRGASSFSGIIIFNSSKQVIFNSEALSTGQMNYVWNAPLSGNKITYSAQVMSIDGHQLSNLTSFTVNPVAFNRCDFDKDGKVDFTDLGLLGANLGPVPPKDSKYDVNGDKYLNSVDLAIVSSYITNKTSKYCI